MILGVLDLVSQLARTLPSIPLLASSCRSSKTNRSEWASKDCGHVSPHAGVNKKSVSLDLGSETQTPLFELTGFGVAWLVAKRETKRKPANVGLQSQTQSQRPPVHVVLWFANQVAHPSTHHLNTRCKSNASVKPLQVAIAEKEPTRQNSMMSEVLHLSGQAWRWRGLCREEVRWQTLPPAAEKCAKLAKKRPFTCLRRSWKPVLDCLLSALTKATNFSRCNWSFGGRGIWMFSGHPCQLVARVQQQMPRTSACGLL